MPMASASSPPCGYEWMYLSLELGLETYKETFFTQVLPRVKPDWRPEDLDCHVFESGVTNTLVAFFQKRLGLQNSENNVILLRVDGAGTEKIINRTDEVVTMLFLSKEGIAAPLHAQLKNGLCYGFFPGRRLKVHETSSNPAIMRRIAGLMAKLHSLEIPDHFRGREPFLWMKTTELLSKVPTSFSNPAMQQDFVASIGSITRLQEEIASIKSLLKDCHSPIVFCHNDIHSANLIYEEESGTVELVDYEYAGPNYLAFDIADHFCEFAGVEEVNYDLYPSKDVQHYWIRMYLEEKQKVKGQEKPLLIEEEAVHHLYCEVNKVVLGCHLMWVVWALFQAANSTLDFDFMQYASQRYKEYLRRKEEFSSLS